MKTPSLKKNFLYSTFYQILVILIPLITAPYISRVLGAEGIGIYSYTLSIQTYFSMFATLGVLSYGTREIAMNRDDSIKRSKLFYEIELMVIIATLICLIGWLLVIIFYKEYRNYFIALSFNLVAVIFDISWFFSGLEEFKYIVVKNSIVKISTVILMFILVKNKSDLLLYILLMSCGTLIGNISMWVKLPNFICRINKKSISLKHHFKESFIYFIPTIATSIYTVLDKTLIGILTTGNSQNGYYEQATKIINLAKAITFTSLNTVMSARTSYLYSNNQIYEIKDKIKKSLDFILLIGFGICFGLIGISNGFVQWFFGKGYDPVINLLKIFSPIIVIIGISNCIGNLYYTPVGKRATSAKFLILGSFINLIINLFLIPRFGAYGAAIGSVIAELIITALYIKFCEGFFTFTLLVEISWKRIFAGISMLLILSAINIMKKGMIYITLFQILIGAIVYYIVLLILKDRFILEINHQMKGIFFSVKKKRRSDKNV
ncbi:flippase [Absiella sp. AM29-15]|uniref:flippase n=1 Tax=Absiella sp. AM29-15 TaxID=2292278 RepID=UPI000E3FD410|nr:flippase [Absiella sp. AM29-15]RGC52540.1 flippase [Absiella sp. AM29-15]